MKQNLIKLFDEKALMSEIKTDTVILIHSTTVMQAIKKLITVHDIVHLNLDVCKRFKADEPVWDLASLTDLSTIRSELFLFHRVDFNPMQTIDTFNNKVTQLIHSVKHRGFL